LFPLYREYAAKAGRTRTCKSSFKKCFHLKQTSAEQLRAKAGKTMVAPERGKGIATFCMSAGMREWAKILQPVVLPGLQGKGPCGKEAFRLT
jgi:hypothetical protein